MHAKRVMVVLGQQLNPDGSMTKILEDRCKTAAQTYSELKNTEGSNVPIIVAGGIVENIGITEAEGMKRELVERYGIDPAVIFQERESTTTFENALYVERMLQCGVFATDIPCEILLITSEFHMPRARFLFEQRLGSKFVVVDVPASNEGLPRQDGDPNGHINQFSLKQRRVFEEKLLAELRAHANPALSISAEAKDTV
ncbi:Hypothetical Protein FCC1311_031472 [Hondaea fermentalgiana]|uniref:DUF218 domain-containing protein n=1 Tax=Hondaea fermentalgiana TaxID=2315210 RepID=A0A2R5GGE8_9STRA|nr:Hypothetical Protein FCC1311_031472 [Hondaea fermentalgiana]|eukprot:GBG26924.1 Hypothetical Protein FCC1311_031472 [Hondaea fermentalgiana]